MARKSKSKAVWHVDGSGRWSRSFGQRGTRIRVFQKRKNGPFYRTVWIPGQGRHQAPLGVHTRGEAEHLGSMLYAKLVEQRRTGQAVVARPTLGYLWAEYRTRCAAFLDNKPRSRADACSQMTNVLAVLGDKCFVDQLTADDCAEYERRRGEGGITRPDGRVLKPTRARSAQADLAQLQMVLNWATTARNSSGLVLLERNPIAKVKLKHELNPVRTVATWERYSDTQAAILEAANTAPTDAIRTRWRLLSLALRIAEATGRRIGAIRQMRWEDIDHVRCMVRWRKEADKKGYESEIAYPSAFLEDLRERQRELRAIGGLLFPSLSDAATPLERGWFDKWLREAEKLANVPPLAGGGWHSYRRKWAIERKHLPLPDVAAAGGWRDIQTLLNVYQQADASGVRAVTSSPTKLREGGVMHACAPPQARNSTSNGTSRPKTKAPQDLSLCGASL